MMGMIVELTKMVISVTVRLNLTKNDWILLSYKDMMILLQIKGQ